jgi:hypothetical protein
MQAPHWVLSVTEAHRLSPLEPLEPQHQQSAQQQRGQHSGEHDAGPRVRLVVVHHRLRRLWGGVAFPQHLPHRRQQLRVPYRFLERPVCP